MSLKTSGLSLYRFQYLFSFILYKMCVFMFFSVFVPKSVCPCSIMFFSSRSFRLLVFEISNTFRYRTIYIYNMYVRYYLRYLCLYRLHYSPLPRPVVGWLTPYHIVMITYHFVCAAKGRVVYCIVLFIVFLRSSSSVNFDSINVFVCTWPSMCTCIHWLLMGAGLPCYLC